jgi:spore maturation protein CgeB
MKTILVMHPGSVVSTADVHAGLVAGLKAHDINVVNYALHGRILDSERFLNGSYRRAKKADPSVTKPTFSDVCYHAAVGVYERMLRFNVDGVVVISGVLLHADTLTLMRRVGVPVGVVLTESPYLMDNEKRIASHVDCVWTNERSAVAEIATMQPNVSYLPHAWLPGVHDKPAGDVAAHDVVFVGTGFSERIALLEGVDWTGIDLGLYGNWRQLGDYSPLRPYVRENEIPNSTAASLYRRAKVGLNLYRTSTDGTGHITHAESLNPRAYELAATGSFHLSTPRAEVAEKFGPLVPTFTTSSELEAQIRHWLARDAERQAVAARLPALVAEDTWIARGGQVLGAMRGLPARVAA